MQQTKVQTSTFAPPLLEAAGRELPEDRTAWEDDAQRAYRWVLRQLDAWCRERNLPRHGNPWTAEEAIRRAW